MNPSEVQMIAVNQIGFRRKRFEIILLVILILLITIINVNYSNYTDWLHYFLALFSLLHNIQKKEVIMTPF